MKSPRQTELFLTESAEYLAVIDRSLEQWERNPSGAQVNNELLRALHSLKALASAMGYTSVSELVHLLEDLLGQLKQSGKTPAESTLRVLSRTCEALRTAVTTPAEDPPHPQVTDLIAALRSAARTVAPEAGRSLAEKWWVRVRLSRDAPMPGARALVILQRVGELGRVAWVDPPESRFPQDDFGREFSFVLVARAGVAAIEAAVRKAGEVEAVELNPAPVAPEARQLSGSHHVRVEASRIENLTRLSAELRSLLSGIAALAAGGGSPGLSEQLRQVSQRLARLEEEIRGLKVTAIWRLFDRFPRMVRHLSRSLGKQVEFAVRGRELEVDRGILDRLADPVLHLIRNALDHGIEPPGERVKTGKPAAGKVVLEAARSGSRLLIRVSDDGRGIDREKVLARGREMGLVEPSVRQLTDDELLRVLAHPGFSTAASPTLVSGRGIGVEVVTSRVGELGGSVRLKTEPGRGSVFELELPGAFCD